MQLNPVTPQNLTSLAGSVQPQITIKPSKQWILPPRPRPGRKPTSASNNCDNDPIRAKKEKKTYKKKSNSGNTNAPVCVNTKSDIIIESALKSIKDENKFLKQELSRLVSDLKQLQLKQKDTQQSHDFSRSKKKRNHLQMEREDSMVSASSSSSTFSSSSSSPSEDDYYLHRASHDNSEDDEISSQISSTPSLMSSTSSLASHPSPLSNPMSLLQSIKEEESSTTSTLKLDEFLTTSFFDLTGNNDTKCQTKNEKIYFKEKTDSGKEAQEKKDSFMLSPPSLPMNEGTDDFEFSFLKTEKNGLSKDVGANRFDSLFDSVKIEDNDVFGEEWDWK